MKKFQILLFFLFSVFREVPAQELPEVRFECQDAASEFACYAELYYEYDSANFRKKFPEAVDAFRACGDSVGLGVLYWMLGKSYIFYRQYKEAFCCFDSSVSYCSNLNKVAAQQVLSRIYCNVASLYLSAGKGLRGLNYLDKADSVLTILEGKGVDIIRLRAIVLKNRGNIFIEQGVNGKGLIYYKEALALEKKAYGEKTSPEMAFTYARISRFYREENDYEQQIAYLAKALEVCRKFYEENHPEILAIQNDLARAYENIGKLSRSVRLLEEVLEKKLKTGAGDESIATGFINLGRIYLHKKEYELGIALMQKAENIAKKHWKQNHYNRGHICQNLARGFFLKGDYNQSLSYINIALSAYTQSLPGDKGSVFAYAYELKAQLHQQLKQFDSASFYYGKALLSTVRGDSLGERMPVHTEVLSERAYPDVLKETGYFYEERYKITGWKYFLERSYKCYRHAAGYVYYLDCQRLRFGRSVYLWSALWKNYYEVYESALRTGYALYRQTGLSCYPEEIFLLSMESKSRLLTKAQYLNSSVGAFLPKALKKEESALLEEIRYYELRRWESGQGSILWASLTDSLQKLEGLKDNFLSYIKHHYPAYYALKYLPSNPGVFALQKYLSPSQCVVEYFCGASSVFVFTLTSDSLTVHHLRRGSCLEKEILRMKDLVQRNPVHGVKMEELIAISSSVGSKLLAIPPGINRLMIIPDGLLNGFPFEALVLPSGAYVSERYGISYGFSLPLIYRSWQVALSRITKVSYFEGRGRVEYYDREQGLQRTLSPLSPIDELGSSISPEMRNLYGFSFSGKEQLKKALVRPGIVHISAHGVQDNLDDHQSFLGISSLEKLYAYELYGLPRIKSRMAVLSACHSGSGGYRKGEGALSLTRGFRFAGCPTVVSSRWYANPETTAELLRYYYDEIKAGKPLDVALQIARKKYLESESRDAISRHPYFWSHLAIYGDTRPIKWVKAVKADKKLQMLAYALLISLVMFLLLRKIRKKSQVYSGAARTSKT